jgi:hypothetical protein
VKHPSSTDALDRSALEFMPNISRPNRREINEAEGRIPGAIQPRHAPAIARTQPGSRLAHLIDVLIRLTLRRDGLASAQRQDACHGPTQDCCSSRADRFKTVYLRAAQAYMLISMPTGTSTIFGVFQVIPSS